MSIDRRKILGLFAASTATALAGCGGGGDAGYIPPARSLWVLNLNPEFALIDLTFGGTTVASALPFPGLTPRLEVEYGNYSVEFRHRSSGLRHNFDGITVDGTSASMLVFYRHLNSARLEASPPGIANYFDSTVPLDIDLFDDAGGVQLETLTFQGAAPQTSRSINCTLRLYAAGSSVLIYDSGLQQRTDSILILPRYPAASPFSGQVAVVGLNYNSRSATAVTWPNTLG